MKYINTRTNVIIDVSGKISGGDWVVLEEKEPPKKPSKRKTQPKKKGE